MSIYFAPMEGISGSVYRSAHHQVFGHVDSYYAPFIFANSSGKISKKDRLELDPMYNEGFRLVPQLLSNCAADCIATAKSLKAMGFDEVNLNIGCPSSTVAMKGRGSGLLRDTQALQLFLQEIFSEVDMNVSIKTRIGFDSDEVLPELVAIYSQYPVAKMIVHPRLRSEFYGGRPHHEACDLFAACAAFDGKFVYNGDIFTVTDFSECQKRFRGINDWMIGRGLLANPALGRQLTGGEVMKREEIMTFLEVVRESYEARFGLKKQVIFLLKELWRYLRCVLSDDDQEAVNQLLHETDKTQFLKNTEALIGRCTIVPDRGYRIIKGGI